MYGYGNFSQWCIPARYPDWQGPAGPQGVPGVPGPTGPVGPEERKESEESQAKLDPPDSKDSQGREVPQVPGESPGPQALWARCYCGNWKGYHRRDAR